MTLANMHDLFEWKLQMVYSSEKRILEMLEDAARDVESAELREAFEHHREETRGQVERIEKVFDTLHRRPRSIDASVVEGLVEEKRRFLNEDPEGPMMDIYHVAAGMKTEHMEIAAYESLLSLAEQMGAHDLAEPLRKNLEEEQATLHKLSGFAKKLSMEASAAPSSDKGGDAQTHTLKQ
ncbi:MAG TPA: ferritin-like domain-containing protein [Candidatus Thermoplasmatota archaeon]|nr:ferritin-like domain-containing protein [Candidatus Thermoplasmatota archaeon]